MIFTHARPRKGIDLTIKLRVIAVTFGVLASMAAGARPVYAVDVLAARGNVTVNTDFSACGTVTFPRPQAVITGSMIATGFGTTGDTQENALVRDVKPIVARNTSSVKVCTEGLNFVRTPTLAFVSYQLQASGPDGDTYVAKNCTRTSNGFSCTP